MAKALSDCQYPIQIHQWEVNHKTLHVSTPCPSNALLDFLSPFAEFVVQNAFPVQADHLAHCRHWQFQRLQHKVRTVQQNGYLIFLFWQEEKKLLLEMVKCYQLQDLS